MYDLLPYLWILFMVSIVTATIVMAIRARPKKAPKTSVAGQAASEGDSFGAQAEPVLDFGDELAQMEKK
jgi:hypothetical protein